MQLFEVQDPATHCNIDLNHGVQNVKLSLYQRTHTHTCVCVCVFVCVCDTHKPVKTTCAKMIVCELIRRFAILVCASLAEKKSDITNVTEQSD